MLLREHQDPRQTSCIIYDSIDSEDADGRFEEMDMCGECTKEEIVPFYACGLQVEANFLNPDASVEVNVDPQSAMVEPPGTTDKENCPSVCRETHKSI